MKNNNNNQLNKILNGISWDAYLVMPVTVHYGTLLFSRGYFNDANCVNNIKE